jgi:hypothetical protein
VAVTPCADSTSSWRFDALYFTKTAPNEEPPEACHQDTARAGLAAAQRLGIPAVLGRIAAARRVVRPTPEGQVTDFLLPELGQIRYLARYCAARMAEAARTGNHDERVEAFEHALALGRIAACNFTIIDYLVGHAVHRLAFDRLRADLVEHPLPEAHLRRALDAIDRQPLPSMLINIEGERLGMLDTVECSHSTLPNDDGHYQPATLRNIGLMMGGQSSPLDPGTWPTPMANLAGWFLPSKRQTTRKVNDLMEAVKRAAVTPRVQRAAVFDSEEWMNRLSARFVLIRLATPSIERALETTDEHRLLADATRIMLAIELHRLAQGTPPDTLDQLAPAILPSVPTDPVNGKPYVYRRLAPAAGSEAVPAPGYVLYAMGADGMDNGGVAFPSDAYRALRRSAPGCDFLMVPPAGMSR